MNEKQEKEFFEENRFEILFTLVGLIMYGIGCYEEDLMIVIVGLAICFMSYISIAYTVVMKKIREIRDSISELQGYLERLGGPDEAGGEHESEKETA